MEVVTGILFHIVEYINPSEMDIWKRKNVRLRLSYIHCWLQSKEAGFMRAKWLNKLTYIIIGKSVIFTGRSTLFKNYKVFISSRARPLWPSLEILLWVPWEKAPSVLDWKVILSFKFKWTEIKWMNFWHSCIFLKRKKECLCAEENTWKHQSNVSWLLQLQWNYEATIKTWTFCPALFLILHFSYLAMPICCLI